MPGWFSRNATQTTQSTRVLLYVTDAMFYANNAERWAANAINARM